MKSYTFCIPGEPVGKGRPRFDMRSGHAYTPAKTRTYEELVRWSYRGGPFFTGAVRMKVTAYLKVPQHLTQARLASIENGETPTKKPDADNILKAVADALNGLAYKDDSQITTVTVYKRWSVDPRVDVQIEND